MPTVTQILVYPVKSCRAVSVTEADLDELGLRGDRRYLVVDQDGKQITQRTHPELALIQPELTAAKLSLSRQNMDTLRLTVSRGMPKRQHREVTVWSTSGLVAEDCGDDAADWISAAVGTTARLVCTGPLFNRPLKNFARHRTGFADAYPLLITNEASLADLNNRLLERGEEIVPMDRFRPNLVVSGFPAFAEDRWHRIKVGDASFESGGPCERCIMTTQDQSNGTRSGPEPLRTLATFRRAPESNAVQFGQNLVNLSKHGRIRVGDDVRLIE